MGAKADQVKDLLIREIWSSGLRHGDILPSCGKLAERLNLGRTTVYRGIKMLCDDGILESRERIGYFVKDERTPGHVSYNLGILIGNRNSSAFNNLLTVYLQSQCQDSGCQGKMFYASGTVLHRTDVEDSLDAHVGVKEQIEHGLIHGLFSQIGLSEDDLGFLRSHQIPCCFVGGFGDSGFPLSVTLSLEEQARLALDKLREQGCRRPILLMPDVDDERTFRWIAQTGVEWLTYTCASDMSSIAMSLCSRPKAERPDGVFIPDDLGAEFFMVGLMASRTEAYHPQLVVFLAEESLVLQPRELVFPLPADTWLLTYSMTELSEKAIWLLLRELREETLPSRHEQMSFHWRMNKV